MRVLVVDESADRAERVRAALLRAGYEVTATLSSPAALLETINQLRPDLIVVDADRIRGMVEQLAQANLRLDERKLVERAKGILMKARGLDEDAAYSALRRMAMDKNRRIGEVARSVIEVAGLLG